MPFSGPCPGKQELSYRKQIARQLRTQYVESIYRPKYYTVTLKSTLRITQGHWKRNHWIDHTRLSIVIDLVVIELFDDEYYRDLEMWVRGQSRSLKIVPLESLATVSYLPSISIVTMAVPMPIWKYSASKNGPSRSLKMARFDTPCMTFY